MTTKAPPMLLTQMRLSYDTAETALIAMQSALPYDPRLADHPETEGTDPLAHRREEVVQLRIRLAGIWLRLERDLIEGANR